MVVVGIAIVLRARYRLFVLLEREDRRVCLECHYPLPSGDQGECPECGRPYDAELVRHLWDNWVNPPKYPPGHTWQ